MAGYSCRNCGAPLKPGEPYCRSCGKKVSGSHGISQSEKTEKISKASAASKASEVSAAGEIKGAGKSAESAGFVPSLSAGGFFVSLLLTALPLAGPLFTLAWALGLSRKKSRRSFARGQLLCLLFALGIAGILFLVRGDALFTSAEEYLSRIGFFDLCAAVIRDLPEGLAAPAERISRWLLDFYQTYLL